jgi:endonuclease YncB( thermonuclease family)
VKPGVFRSGLFCLVAGISALALAGACSPTAANAVVDTETLIVNGARVSLHQFDAPDVNAVSCENERLLAGLTFARMEELIATATTLEVRKTGMACLDFMTCDAFVRINGRDMGELLIEEGLATRGAGPGEPAHDWCSTALEPADPTPVAEDAPLDAEAAPPEPDQETREPEQPRPRRPDLPLPI